MSATCVEVITKALSRTDSRDVQNRRGTIQSSLGFFSRNESEVHAPPVIPAGWIRLPEPLRALQNDANAATFSGLFTSIGRAWMSIDNRFYLWSIKDRTFTFVDTPYGVIRGAYLIRCDSTWFGAGVSFAVAITTENTVTLRGLAFEDVPKDSSAQFVEQVISLGSESSVVKIVQHASSHRIFACASNGNLYEIQIAADRSVTWINASVYFGGTPGLQAVGEFLSNLRKSWSTSHSPLVDMTLDHEKSLLYTLSAKGHIDLWNVKTGELSLLCRAEHNIENLKSSLKTGVPTTLPQLKSIHVTVGRKQGCLTAISREGDRYIFATKVQRWDISGGQTLGVVERVPATFLSAWSTAFQDVYMSGDNERALISSIPPSGFPTVDNALECISDFDSFGTKCFGFDQWDDAPYADAARSQFTTGPAELVLLTDAGILVLVRLRPVDVAASLLMDREFSSALKLLEPLGPSETCAMLCLLAAGGTTATLPASSSVESFDATCRNVVSRIRSHVPGEIVRRIMVYLREINVPAVTEVVGPNQLSSWSVTFSPFAAGVTLAIARSLSPVWSCSILDPNKKTLALNLRQRTQACLAVSRIHRLLELCRDELWYATPDIPPNCTFSTAGATVVSTAVHPAIFDQVQSVRFTTLHRVASVAIQVLRFCDFVGDISPSVVARAARLTKDKVTFTFRDVVDAPTKLADLGRQILKIVVDTERGAGIPNYDRLLELFDDMERDCRDIFCHADSVANQAALELDHLKRLNDQGLQVDGVETTVSRLVANAAAIYSTGAMERVCAQLLDVGAVQGALEVLLAAAAQQKNADAEKAYWGNLTNAALEVKTSIVAKIASILERIWRSQDRGLFNLLLIDPGQLWRITPDDNITHFLLMDWLSSPRLDAGITRDLRRIISSCPSKWLEQYLQANSKRLALETAEFYRYQRKDFALACRAYLSVASGALSHIPAKDRVLFRAHRTMDALVCAREAGLPSVEIARIATQHDTLETQHRLCLLIKKFLDSNTTALQASVSLDGNVMTQRQACEQHLSTANDRILSSEEIFAIASYYRALGGVEIQLRILASHHVADQDLYAGVMNAAFDGATNASQTAEQLLAYRDAPGFPMHVVVAHLLIAQVPSLDQLLLEKVGVPVEEALAAMKLLTDSRLGASRSSHLPESFFTLPLDRIFTAFADIIALCTQLRRGSPAALLAHLRYLKGVCAKLGRQCDGRLPNLEETLEEPRMRHSRGLNASMRW